MTGKMPPQYPQQVSGNSGGFRWKTSDGRTHDTKIAASRAQEVLGPTPLPDPYGGSPLTERQRVLVSRHDQQMSMVGYTLLAIGALMALSAGIIAWQAFAWLRTGIWPDLAIHDGLSWAGVRLSSSWVGFAQIGRWFGDLPLSAVPFTSALLILWRVFRDDESLELREALRIRARGALSSSN